MTQSTPIDGPPAARLLDLTRLVSRVARGWSGVDRVEAAYLRHLLTLPDPLFSLITTGRGTFLLDQDGTRALADRLFGRVDWGKPDLASYLFRKQPRVKRAAFSDLARLAIARTRRNRPPLRLARHLPAGTAWINVGHSNLLSGGFEMMGMVPGGRSSVLIHDTIPLDYPEYSSPGSADFTDRLAIVARRADLVIYNSRQTQIVAERWMAGLGRVPPGVAALLGVEVPEPNRRELPEGIDLSKPCFVALGTIEPRKNHRLLFDIWEDFARTLPPEQIPDLHVVGRRGWMNEDVFAWLDTSPLVGRHVHEWNGLSDGAVSALVQGARGLLMPSFAEGFGLPPAEAHALGTPVIANPLPVYREILGNNPVYADVGDMYSWRNKILELSQTEKPRQTVAMGNAGRVPTWQEHFNLVLKVT